VKDTRGISGKLAPDPDSRGAGRELAHRLLPPRDLDRSRRLEQPPREAEPARRGVSGSRPPLPPDDPVMPRQDEEERDEPRTGEEPQPRIRHGSADEDHHQGGGETRVAAIPLV